MKNGTKAILTFAKKMKDWPPHARKRVANLIKENKLSAKMTYALYGDERTADDILKEVMGEKNV